jgi:hypothetical protein
MFQGSISNLWARMLTLFNSLQFYGACSLQSTYISLVIAIELNKGDLNLLLPIETVYLPFVIGLVGGKREIVIVLFAPLRTGNSAKEMWICNLSVNMVAL